MPETASTGKKYSLADTQTIYSLCFEFIEMHLELDAQLCHEKITAEDAARQTADLVQWMSWTLGGENPEFIAASDWSGDRLGRHLRTRFASDLILLSDEDRANFNDDKTIIIFAMCRFMNEVQELIAQLHDHKTENAEGDAKDYHDLCVKWTEILTDRPYKRIVVAS